MAKVCVYVLTYRRPALLRRALASLQAQSFLDWRCELHNDEPSDRQPNALVLELNDPRIQLRQHERNFGALATFNLVHSGAPEPFFSILEDDNWWEPTFLQRMVEVLSSLPNAKTAWANMRLWRETETGWTDTGKTIWPVIRKPHLAIAWPQLLQMDAPLYSNGAMLMRSEPGDHPQLPSFVPFDVMENLRERAFHYPVVLVPEPLANFALTLQTSRSNNLSTWVESQALLSAAFLKHVALSAAEQSALWNARRTAVPPAISGLFFAAFLQPTRGFLKHALLRDWWIFLRGCARHPLVTLAALGARRRRPALWRLCDESTARACVRPQGAADVAPNRLASRAELAGL